MRIIHAGVLAACIFNVRAAPPQQPTSTTTAPTAGFSVTTIDGQETTVAQDLLPEVMGLSSIDKENQESDNVSNTTETEASEPSSSVTPDASTEIFEPFAPSKDFPKCGLSGRPFCLPGDGQTVFVGDEYLVTWNPDYFDANSTIAVKLNYANDSDAIDLEAWSSDTMSASWGVTIVEITEDMLQGHDTKNLTFVALVSSADVDGDGNGEQSKEYDGPNVTIKSKNYHDPSSKTQMLDKESLAIGLPIGLGGCALIVLVLFFSMKKQRKIGLGNVMGNRRGRHGYADGRNRRQRMGLGRGRERMNGNIRLDDEERELKDVAAHREYRNEDVEGMRTATGQGMPPPTRYGRDISLASLIEESEDDETPAGKAFGAEVEKKGIGKAL